MAIEIVSFPMKNGGSFHSYVKLPEGNQSIILFFFIANSLVQCSSRLLVTSICLASARDEGCCGGSKGTRTPAPSFDLASGNSTYLLNMEY